MSSTGSIVHLSTTSGSSSVSSSGYRSPSIITLDSPSPPNSPVQPQRLSCAQQTPVRSSCMMNSTTTATVPPTLNYHQQQQQSHTNNINTIPPSSNTFNSMAMSFLDTNDATTLSNLPFLDTDDVLGTNSFFSQF